MDSGQDSGHRNAYILHSLDSLKAFSFSAHFLSLFPQCVDLGRLLSIE